ncbi:MAG: 50S ribosomal protein L28 [Bacteroidota bacterium]
MARICDITGKRPQRGNTVSHAHNKTKRWFYPNLQQKKFYLPEQDIWLTLKVSTAVLRTINKKGIGTVLKEANQRGVLSDKLSKLAIL